MELSWTTEKRKIKELIPFEYNPRILTENKKQKLTESLNKFNLAEIPAINLDGIILAGHQRIKVLIELGRGEEIIDVRMPNRLLSEEEMKEYNITSNIPVGFWDLETLDTAFGDIDLLDLGLNVDEIKIPELEVAPLKEEEEDPIDLELQEHSITCKGDLYELESTAKGLKHRIHCADSTDSDAFNKLMNNKLANLVLTDPPYNVDYQGGTKKKLKIINDSMSNDVFFQFLTAFFNNVFLFASPGASIYVFHSDTEGANFRNALTNSGFKLSQCLIWLKNSIVMGRQDYHWKHEPILYGWKIGAAHNWYSDRKQSTVLEFDRPFRSTDHPTMKPLDILEYLITNSSLPNDIVCDGFVGSGSTLIASEKTRRNCYSQELGTKYCDVTIKRWISYMESNNLAYNIIRNDKKLTEDQINEFTK